MVNNQNPEQIVRDNIDKQLLECGWIIQDKNKINLTEALGIAIREYPTAIGPADYVLFVNKIPVGIIEAKREEEGVRLSMVENQSQAYATAKLKHLNNDPLPFVYESTGIVTLFTDSRDPKPCSRLVFTFHRPETFQQWLKEGSSLRKRLLTLPTLPANGLRDCQVTAITNLEKSFKENRPKALVQMATGSGKTFTAITFIYRLLKYAQAKKILFLVDTKNLGEQAEAEFRNYVPQGDNRLFPELHNVLRLTSSNIPKDGEVYISTIQRLYAVLKGTELDERDEEQNPNEKWIPKEPLPVSYSPQIPIEFFDFIVIDECHRSIYNTWKQVLDYFDAFQIGLTATPDNRTFGYFKQNLVCDYGYQKAVEDGVLVPYNVFEITTKITKEGASIEMGEYVDKRERLTRQRTWEQLDEEVTYTNKQLDDRVVNENQIRLIAKSVKEQLPSMFPDRFNANNEFEVPKTLIFAKSDSHADDIIRIVREEFGEGNNFCKKITYRSKEDSNKEDAKSILQQFRNDYMPRIAVTVDMIATGTDIRPLEVLLFMRDVKSRTYYEQMKGRGTRTCSLDELRTKGSPSAKYSKDHFVIIDAIGVERSQKTDSRTLEKRPSASLKQLLEEVKMGNTHEDLLSTLANRLIRLDKQISQKEKDQFTQKAQGKTINQVVKNLLNAHDPDMLNQLQDQIKQQQPNASPQQIDTELAKQHQIVKDQAIDVFNNWELRDLIINLRKKYDQIIDHINPDELVNMGWLTNNTAIAQSYVDDFKAWINEHKDTITALQLFYGQPYQRRHITYQMIKELAETIKADKPILAPLTIWHAYEQLEKANGKPQNELTALVALVRRICNIDDTLTAYDKTVDKNFQNWTFKKQAGTLKFNDQQMQWLRQIKNFVANSFHIDKEDFDLSPFNNMGGLGKFYQLFKTNYLQILDELNEELAA